MDPEHGPESRDDRPGRVSLCRCLTPWFTRLARQAPAPAPAKQRDPWFDNAKMALVTLVVIGHSWTLLPADDAPSTAGSTTSSTPGTSRRSCIVTGYLSKSFEYTRARMWNLVTTVAVPYVIFEGVYALFRHEVGGVDFERLWANPHWPMWYLSAMFFWRLMTPIFKRMPGKVVVAVAISLLAGLYANDILDNARIFGLLPFFVLGPEDARRPLEPAPHAGARGGTASRCCSGCFVLARFSGELDRDRVVLLPHPLRRPRPEQPARHHHPDVAAARGAGRLLRVLRCRPARRKTWFTALGGATLVVYLFHGFVILGAEFAGFTPLGRGPLAVRRWC